MLLHKFCLFILSCQYLLRSILANSSATSEEDVKILLNIARDYRNGGNKVPINLSRSIHYYQHALEKPSDNPKLLSTILYELCELLEQNPTLVGDYSPWDLLTGAAELGHEEAQYRLSVAYGFGIFSGGLVPMDVTRSLVLSHMSALSGHALAHLNMGYRYFYGIGVNPSCEKALPYYEYAAIYAIEEIAKQEGRVPELERRKLSDLVDYSGGGKSGGANGRQDVSNEVLEYYESLAESGDSVACAMLGTMYSTGTKHAEADEEKALYYLRAAIRARYVQAYGLFGYLAVKYIHKHAKDPADTRETTILLRGGKTEIVFSEVAECLLQAVKKNDAQALMGLGFAHEHGVLPAFPRNLTRSTEYYSKALHAHPDAGYYLGNLLVRQYVEYEVLLSQFGSLSQAKAFGILSDYSRLFPFTSQSIEEEIARTAAFSHSTSQKPTGRKVGREENPVAVALILQAYSMSAQLGHIPAQFAATHLAHHGLPSLVSVMQTKLNERLLQQSKVFGGPSASASASSSSSRAAPRLQAEHTQHLSWETLQQVLGGNMQGVSGSSAFLASSHSCESLLQGYKVVAERNSIQQKYFTKAHQAFEAKQYSAVLGYYSLLASLGYETAQSNLARLLSEPDYCPATTPASSTNGGVENLSTRLKPLPTHVQQQYLGFLDSSSDRSKGSGSGREPENTRIAQLPSSKWAALTEKATSVSDNNSSRGLRQVECELRAYNGYTLSSLQGNADSLLQLGDYYYYGRANLTTNAGKTLQYYTKAADLHHIQALFNLAMMYQFGLGVDQDFHLAKRYYDLAAELDPTRTRMPRDVMLFFLHGHKMLKQYIQLVQADARGEAIVSPYPTLEGSNLTAVLRNFVNVVQFRLTFYVVKMGWQLYVNYQEDWHRWADWAFVEAKQYDGWLQGICAALEEYFHAALAAGNIGDAPPTHEASPKANTEATGAALKQAANAYYLSTLAPYFDNSLQGIRTFCQMFQVTSEEFMQLMVCLVLLIGCVLYKLLWVTNRHPRPLPQ